MTPDELNALCAEKVAGCVPCDNWKPFMHDSMMKIDDSCCHANCGPRPMWPQKYTEQPAAVIELLEKEKGYEVRSCYDYPSKTRCEVTVYRSLVAKERHMDKACCGAPTFAEAGVRALLKAHGCEVGE